MEGVPAAVVTNVLDNDDLLIEILLRVAFPTTLVRAALVCKRWFHHASHRGLLRRFRELHPPRLLGFYRSGHFVPMLPQPPELAAVVQRVASYSLGAFDDEVSVRDCRNGSIYVELFKPGSGDTVGVHNPLCSDRGVAVVPPLSRHQPMTIGCGILSKENEQGELSYMDVSVAPGETTTLFMVHMLQEGVWHMHTSVTIQLPPLLLLRAVLVDNKIYLTGSMRDIIVLDLATSSISTFQLPQEVEYVSSYNPIMLSPADDTSGVYLIQVELQLIRIWLRKGDIWLLVDTIRFREMVANLRMSDYIVADEHTPDVEIIQVGDNAEFAFLKMGRCTLYLDIKRRTLRKVHERTQHDLSSLDDIYPFMMTWPPTFPTLKDDFARNAM
ncbi:unnamed protein product [Alopecurus aequalis]